MPYLWPFVFMTYTNIQLGLLVGLLTVAAGAVSDTFVCF